MSDDLVKRLQASRSVWTNENGKAQSRPSDLEMEAAAALVAKDAEIARLWEAVEPSGDTKGAYMGKIKDPETKRMVSWTAIKMIMAMISARADLNTQHKGETP